MALVDSKDMNISVLTKPQSFDVEEAQAPAAESGQSYRRLMLPSIVVSLMILGTWNIFDPSRPECTFEYLSVQMEPAVARRLGATDCKDGSVATESFLSKVIGAAAQGCTAAFIAAMLSAVSEPIVNRLLVKRMTFAQAYSEIYANDVAKFFLTTFPTNMLKFPIFEVINIMLSFTSLSGSVRGVANGFLFCTIMLPVTNYRFRKSMNLEIKPSLLYQAYIPTVSRDIVYGWSRGLVGGYVNSAVAPQSAFMRALAFGITVFIACIISSPGNEWRGYTLQPPAKKLPFKEYFKPVNYARSTGIGATIMMIALMTGNLVTPYVEFGVSSLASIVRG